MEYLDNRHLNYKELWKIFIVVLNDDTLSGFGIRLSKGMKFSNVMVYIIDVIFKVNDSGGLFGSLCYNYGSRQAVDQIGVAVLSSGGHSPSRC